MYLCQLADHSSTPAERDNQERENGFLNIARMEKHSDCPSFWKFESYQMSSVMLEASSTRCVHSKTTLSWTLDRTCVKLCATVKKQILFTSLSPCDSSQGYDQPCCCTSVLHQGASIVLGVYEGYDKVEAVSEGGVSCTTSNCLPVPLPFLLLLLLSELSYAPPPRLQQPFTWCPNLPQFLQVLMSALLVLFWFWCLPLPFSLPLLRESTCVMLSLSAPVSFPADVRRAALFA